MRNEISVVIVSFKNPEKLERCLQTLLKNEKEEIFEVIVIDNDSNDSTRELEAHFPEVRFFWNQENVGYAPACNQGAALASGEYLLFLNPDTEILSGSLRKLKKALLQDPKLGAVGPLSNYSAGWQNMQYHLPEQGNGFEDSLQVFEWLEKNRKDEKKEVKLLIGFCLLMSKKFFSEIEGMDPELMLGMDDLDLSWRIRNCGKKLSVVLDSFVYHVGQQSFEKLLPERRHWMEKYSREKFAEKLAKHYGGVDQIPKSWDLWEVDWFEAKKELGKPSRQNICLIWGTENIGELQFSLDFLETILAENEQILLLSQQGNDLSYQGKLDIVELKWQRSKGWLQLLERGVKMLDDGGLIVLKPGNVLSRYQLQKMRATRPEGAFVFSMKNFETENEVETELSVCEKWTGNQWSSFYLPQGFQGLPKVFAKSEEFFVLNWIQKIQEPMRRIEEGYSDGYGIYGNQELTESISVVPKKIHFQLSIASLPGLHVWLKELREKGLEEAVFRFTNSLCPTFDPQEMYSTDGVDPRMLKRELLLGGYALEFVEGLGAAVKYPSEYFGITHAMGFATAEEKKWRIFKKLEMSAKALKTDLYLDKKVSVILLAFNQVEYTKKCIESLQENVAQCIEIIVINNGSKDETKEYLDSLTDVIVKHNADNLGVSVGWNQGIDLATGEYFFILNNDVIVPPGAIENLVRTAENHKNVGVVAPRTNKIAGPQIWENFNYSSEEEIPARLDEIQQANALSAWNFHRIKGFALLLPKEVVARVGYFDEGFGKGNFEDDDYSVRLQYAGYELLVADDSVIFHYGSVSFRQAGVDWNALMQENQKRFNEKWKEGRAAKSNPLSAKFNQKAEDVVYTEDQLLMQIQGGDQDADIYLALAELKVQEKKKEKAFHYLVCALEKRPESREISNRLIQFLNENYPTNEHKQVLGYLQNRFPQNSFLNPKNETRSPEIEDVANQLNKMFETGDIDAAQNFLNDVSTKLDTQTINQYQGLIHYYRTEYPQAFRCFEKVLELDPTNEDALFNYFDTGVRLKVHQPVIEKLEYALSIDDSLKEIKRLIEELRFHREGDRQSGERMIALRELNLTAENCIREGLLQEAESQILKILELEESQFRALNNLGLIRWYQGNVEEAWNLFVQSVEANSFYSDSILNLYDVAVLSKRVDEFLPYLEMVIQQCPDQYELLKIQQEIAREEIPQRLKNYFQKDQEMNLQLTELQKAKELLENREYEKATHAFLEIIEKEPRNSEAYNGLGVIAYYWKQYQESYNLIRESLEIRLLDEDALLNLWDVSHEVGKQFEARQLLEEAYSLQPGFQKVAAVLEVRK